MLFDLSITNPPYNVGGQISKELLSHSDFTSCLMPLSKYQNLEMYRHVCSSICTVDPHLFNGEIDVGYNLCICAFSTEPVDLYRSYEDLMFESFEEDLKPFYKVNSALPRILEFKDCRYKKALDFNFDLEIIESVRLPYIESMNTLWAFNGYKLGDNMGYKINVKHDYSKLPSGMVKITFPTKKAKENYILWAYQKEPLNALSNLLLYGLKMKSASPFCSIAIPQIDWDIISDNELWVKGNYDDAVLSVMSLKRVGQKIVKA